MLHAVDEESKADVRIDEVSFGELVPSSFFSDKSGDGVVEK
jgi:hypothetical protein